MAVVVPALHAEPWTAAITDGAEALLQAGGDPVGPETFMAIARRFDLTLPGMEAVAGGLLHPGCSRATQRLAWLHSRKRNKDECSPLTRDGPSLEACRSSLGAAMLHKLTRALWGRGVRDQAPDPLADLADAPSEHVPSSEDASEDAGPAPGPAPMPLEAAPPETVVSKGEWLAVSTEGFSEQQRGRPLEHLVKELVQNALDSVGAKGCIALELRSTGPRTITVGCGDDGPGAEDLSKLNIVFVTSKKDGVTERGRMGRGFKELLSIASSATVRSRDQDLRFTIENGARRVTLRRELPWHAGFTVSMEVCHDDADKPIVPYFRSLLPPDGVVLAVNGEVVPARAARHVVEARLTTERFARGRWEKPSLATRVRLVPVAHEEKAQIYEMGIPVASAEWTEPFHCDVQQRVPMNPNRDAVMTGYPAKLHRACLAALVPEMDKDRALQSWVGEAAGHVAPAVQQAVVGKAFGGAVVRGVAARGRFDFNADAEELGLKVVHTSHMPQGFRQLLQQHMETSATVSKREYEWRSARATEIGLTRADVLSLDLEAPRQGLENAARAITTYGREAVLTRMEFASWFCEAVHERRHGAWRAVPVKAAYFEAGSGKAYMATWSIGNELTLSLAVPQNWSAPLQPDDFTLLVHELAHHEAFHHGRSFAREVETCAGAAVHVMLERAAEFRERFPSLATGPSAGSIPRQNQRHAADPVRPDGGAGALAQPAPLVPQFAKIEPATRMAPRLKDQG